MLRRSAGRDQLPIALVAHDGDELWGTASLTAADLEERPDLTPWLAGVYVVPSHRGRGLGGVLVRAVEDLARDRGFTRLHLITAGQESFYAALGWRTLEQRTHLGEAVTVMMRDDLRVVPTDPHDAAEMAIRTQGLAYPETTEEFPWGHRALKVRRKAFVFMSRARGLSLSVKLPSSCHVALDLPFTEPTAYGLARSGWVTARFAPGEPVPLEMLAMWVEESYRAVAPKRTVARLDAGA
jgi:GNAT superfamily N-acetyltransferase/predicted DNA-binding protein (MmcQ/YjbR family)